MTAPAPTAVTAVVPAAVAAAAAEVAAGYRHVPADADAFGYLPFDGWGRPISRATAERLQVPSSGAEAIDADADTATERRLEEQHFDPGAEEMALPDPDPFGSGWLAWREV